MLPSDLLGNQSRRPWDDEEFGDPVDLRAVDDVDVGDFLADWWHGSLPDEDGLDDEEKEMWEPFGLTFPGLDRAPLLNSPYWTFWWD